MDEDSIVHEIVKSLAFEIEAVNQDNVLKWTTTNGTPLNVKVRVRNKDEPRLVQRGAIPVPRIGITAPEKLRLISSDQTILSFNVYLEDDLVKQEESKRRSGLKLFSIGGCLGTYSDDDGPYLPGSSKLNGLGSKTSSKSDSGILDDKVAQIMGANTLPQQQKSFFGKCKRGGCLDPPFGEDKYPYGLPKTNRHDKLEFEIHEIENNKLKLKPGGCLDPTFSEEKYPCTPEISVQQEKSRLNSTSEIADKKLGHSICITSKDTPNNNNKELTELETSVQTTKKSVDLKRLVDIYARPSKENSLVSNYSNSIITYPTDISSSETIFDQFPNKKKSTKSYDESLRQSYEYPQSYFVVPNNVLRNKEEQRRYTRELSNNQIRKSCEETVSATTDNFTINKTNSIEHTSNCQNSAKPALTQLQSNDIKTTQCLSEEAQDNNATFPHLVPNFTETMTHVQTKSTNMDVIKSVPGKEIKPNLRISPRNSFNENNIKFLENTNNSMSIQDNILQAIDSHEILPSSVFSTQEKDESTAIKLEPEDPNDLIIVDSFPRDNSNIFIKDEKKDVTTDLTKQCQIDTYPIHGTGTETIKEKLKANTKSSHSEILDKLYTTNETTVALAVIENDSTFKIPSQRDLIKLNQDEIGIQKVERTKLSVLLPNKMDSFNGQSNPEILQLTKPQVVAAISPISNKKTMNMTENLFLNLEDKVKVVKDDETNDNIATLNEIFPEFHSEEGENSEKKQKEHINLSNDDILSTENIEFDISSTPSMNSIQENSLKGYTNYQVNSVGEQNESTIILNAANVDSVIIQKDLIRDENLKITSDSSQKVINTILQKTPFITRQDSGIHNDEVNKSNPLKRNTFTITGSDVSLLKQQEEDEITETLPDMYFKSTDKAKFNDSNHTNNKFHDSDANNNTASGTVISSNNLQDNENDINLKITNKASSLDETRNNIDILNERNKREENTVIDDTCKDQIFDGINDTASNDTEVLLDRIPENKSYQSQKPILIHVEKSKIFSESLLNFQKHPVTAFTREKNRKLEAKNYKDASVKSSKSSIIGNVKEFHIEKTDECKLVIIDQHDDKETPLATNSEAKNDINLEESIPVTAINSNSKNNNEVNACVYDYYDQRMEITSLASETYAKNISNIDSKLTNNDKSALYTQPSESCEKFRTVMEVEKRRVDNLQNHEQNIDKLQNLHLETTDSNKYSLITTKCDQANHFFNNEKDLENIISQKEATADYTTITQKAVIGSTISDYSNILSADPKTAGLYELYDSSGIDLDIPQEKLLKNESELNLNITDNSKDGSVNNIINKTGQKYQQLEDNVYINSDVDPSQKTVLISNSSDRSDFGHKELNGVPFERPIYFSQEVILDNAIDPRTEISEHSNQPQSEIAKGSSLDLLLGFGNINNTLKMPNVEIPSSNIDAPDSYSTNYQKSSTVEPSIYTNKKSNIAEYQMDSKTIVQNFARYDTESEEKKGKDKINEILSNISEHMEEKKRSEKGVIFSRLNTESNKNFESMECNSVNIAKDSTATINSITDFDSKLSNGNYNEPRNKFVNSSISTLNIGTDKDKNKTISEPLATKEYINRSLIQKTQRTAENLTDTSTSNASINGVVENHEKFKVTPVPVQDLVEQDNLGRIPSLISHDQAFAIYRQPDLITQNGIASPYQQVAVGKQHRSQTGVHKTNLVTTESVPTRQYKSLLYLDMSFYSYIDDNNQRIIKTHNPLIQQQHDSGTVTVIKTLIRHGNQIRIPVDKENDLSLNILEKVDIFNKDDVIGIQTSHVPREKHDEIDRISNQSAVLNKNLRIIYESELIPLHNDIKALTREVNTLTVKREKLQETKRNITRTRSLRLIPVKRCGCRRM